MAPTSENFYQYQQRRLGILFSWGFGGYHAPLVLTPHHSLQVGPTPDDI